MPNARVTTVMTLTAANRVMQAIDWYAMERNPQLYPLIRSSNHSVLSTTPAGTKITLSRISTTSAGIMLGELLLRIRDQERRPRHIGLDKLVVLARTLVSGTRVHNRPMLYDWSERYIDLVTDNPIDLTPVVKAKRPPSISRRVEEVTQYEEETRPGAI